ncbi:phosphoenolpyruvate--protein phosphotransferase [Sphaerisporangium album]|uniref:phosphoenolpyruvate--glycerone phosphotransferase n=1 Tax=Sphaerisporangium album TaxID=509200 RepID=A0A367FT40_9ACTN|nr:dihydroxyacetone kinase phosphoryl donor subunit DhaM [Sphaerisporangium album]RCG33099.1 phosphoenolpyruvate--protein phosphotransferase [Sphaerisporangium album]
MTTIPQPLVGVVLISHSDALATSAAALAVQIAGPDVQVVPAGGTDDGGLGTSPDKVTAAIQKVDRGVGVVLIPDMGGSVLTARLLEVPGQVAIADVPFVEGAIAAAVQAGIGGTLQDVLDAAEDARIYRKL